MLFYSVVGVFAGLCAILSLLSGDGMVDEEGWAVTGATAGLFPVAIILALSLPGALAAYGLWNHRGWTRPLLMAWVIWMAVVFLPVLAGMVAPGAFWMSAVMAVLSIPIAWVYLYAWPSVTAYYAGIAEKERADPAE